MNIVILGLLCGVCFRCFGFGGGFFLVPALFETTNEVNSPLDMLSTIQVVVIVMLVNSGIHVLPRCLKSPEKYKQVFRFTPVLFIGALAGGWLAISLGGKTLQILFIAYLLMSLLFGEAIFRHAHIFRRVLPTESTCLAMVASTAGMLGVGGSVFLVPWFYLSNNEEMKMAVELSQFCTFFIMLGSSFSAFFGMHQISFSFAWLNWLVVLVACMQLGSFLGQFLLSYLPKWAQQIGYRCLLAIVTLGMIIKGLT